MRNFYSSLTGKALATALLCFLLSGGLLASADFTCFIKCPPNIMLDCGANSDPGITGRPYFEPVCAIPNPGPGDYTYVDVVGSLPGYSKVIYREFSGFDPSYGPSTCTQIIYFRNDDTNNTPPAFEDCPADVTVNSAAEIPPVANPTAGPGVVVTYNGETIDESCGPESYTITRMWTAVDECGNEAVCKQKITVKKKLTNDCYSLEYAMEYNEERNTTRFTYELCLIGRNCKDISNIRFSIPCNMPKEYLLESSSSLRGLKVEINNRTGRCDGRYDVQFEGFADGVMKKDPNKCITFSYLLKGDLREHVTDVKIKAGNQTGLDFLGLQMDGSCEEGEPTALSTSTSTGQKYRGRSGKVNVGTPGSLTEGISEVSVFPNPTREQLTLGLTSASEQRVDLQVIDAVGRTKLTRAVEVIPGGNRIELNVADLPAGLYRVILTPTEGQRTVYPFLRMQR
ncbi:T9SS type A sorting domain-containing protein [Lewinella sp. JB7]|uniref:T9SS type A sorting domain-containing protein n=1 Tax=Lewinella sp. JB7 TaxID=2962887 RepID=UPI0020C9AA1A|nr:T9SS type A sorting domain-containing protein [Lewinella sp. JB7]MCP9234669.1 T9SS type A sorting domain-containing protein [Lewinella sp. JB7]